MEIVEKKGCTNYVVRNDAGQERKVHAEQVKPVYDMVEPEWSESEEEGPEMETGNDMVEPRWSGSEEEVQPKSPIRKNERYDFRPRVFRPTRFV